MLIKYNNSLLSIKQNTIDLYIYLSFSYHSKINTYIISLYNKNMFRLNFFYHSQYPINIDFYMSKNKYSFIQSINGFRIRLKQFYSNHPDFKLFLYHLNLIKKIQY